MGGVFGVVSKNDCVMDLYFGTDYHSHLGTSRGGMAVFSGNGFSGYIHNIENIQFRAKFESDLAEMSGNMGIGCISDTEAQPLTVCSHHGHYALTTVGRVNNIDELVKKAFQRNYIHFLEMSRGEINPTELVAALIDQEETIRDGILGAQEAIDGSCTMLVLTHEGIYAARDRLGRTPLLVGKKDESYCVSLESSALPNLGYSLEYELGPGEIVLLTPEGIVPLAPPRQEMKICAFLWVYYGYPASTYEGRNVEIMRYKCGQALARGDTRDVDAVAGVPDSGIAHALGYSNESGIPYSRPLVKYTPTWSRSFIPQEQSVRSLVAKMKLIPIPELIRNKRLLICDDSIVRGTQLGQTVALLHYFDAREVHVRPACPPLMFGCKYLNFSRSRSEMDLITRRSIMEIEGREPSSLDEYCDPESEKYHCMVECIRKKLSFTSLRFQRLEDMIDAIGLPACRVCTYCWNGRE